MTIGRDTSRLPGADHPQQGRARAMPGQAPARPQSLRLACPGAERARVLGTPHAAQGRAPPARGCGPARRACGGDAPPGTPRRWGEPRAPYLHQLPPVLPRNSFFSEFQMNFFQLPSSLALPRAMVAAQRRRLRRGLRRARALRSGCRAAPGPALRRLLPPLRLRRPECRTRRGAGREPSAAGGWRGRRERRAGPRAGRLRAPHLLVARGRSRAPFGPPRAPPASGSRGPREPAAVTPPASRKIKNLFFKTK